jgi:methylisocitrate lyase
VTPGEAFRAALDAERPLQVAGAINAYGALLAQRAGFRALYVSGAGVANYSLGLPDLGVIGLGDVVADTARITSAVDLPVLVDIDIGWGHALTIDRAVKELERAGAAGVQIEDQAGAKRCGHRPGKAVVEAGEMVERVRAAVGARRDPSFVIVARTDARAVEGLDAAVQRALRYAEAGADVIFAEAPESAEELRTFTHASPVPVLANMTEFGVTPLLRLDEVRAAGVAIALYPLSAARAAARATESVYRAIREHGDQSSVLEAMQTRDELYDVLDYLRFERIIDAAREDE